MSSSMYSKPCAALADEQRRRALEVELRRHRRVVPELLLDAPEPDDALAPARPILVRRHQEHRQAAEPAQRIVGSRGRGTASVRAMTK